MATKVFFHEGTGTVIIRGAKVVPGSMDFMYRNFAGAKTEKNAEGNRNFCIKITKEDAEELTKKLEERHLHINIKETKDGEYFFKVNVRYDKYPPIIAKVKTLPNGRKLKTELAEENIAILDKTLIAEADLSVNPHYLSTHRQWTVYLNTLKFTPLVDPIEEELEELEAESEYPTEDDEVPFD